ncbi:hypothetical protein evm_010630 [Chilo suppressalis]|nr:hypothetical protein evm_010630 [Chilo suppressalis]
MEPYDGAILKSIMDWRSALVAFSLVLYADGFSKYGRSCKDIGCLNSEVCVLAEDQCSFGQTSNCGTYPTCKKKSQVEGHSEPAKPSVPLPTPKPHAPSNTFDSPPSYPAPAPPRNDNPYGGSSPYGGHSQGGGSPYGGNNSPYGGNNPPYGGNNSPYGGNNSPYGGNNPSYGGSNPPYGGSNPPYGGSNPPYGGNNSPYGGGNSPYGGGNSPYGGTANGGRNPYGGNSPYGGSRPSSGGSFGSGGGGGPLDSIINTLNKYANNGGGGSTGHTGSTGTSQPGSNGLSNIFGNILNDLTKNGGQPSYQTPTQNKNYAHPGAATTHKPVSYGWNVGMTVMLTYLIRRYIQHTVQN